MNGASKTIVADTLQALSMGNRVVAAFLNFKTFFQLKTITPKLHYSYNPMICGDTFGPLPKVSKPTNVLWAWILYRASPNS